MKIKVARVKVSFFASVLVFNIVYRAMRDNMCEIDKGEKEIPCMYVGMCIQRKDTKSKNKDESFIRLGKHSLFGSQ